MQSRPVFRLKIIQHDCENVSYTVATPQYQYDVCLVALSDLRTDARSYNIARALVLSGRRVCVLSPDWSAGQRFEGLDHVAVPCPSDGRLYKKWLRFSREAATVRDRVRARSFWAEDLWSLRAAAHLAHFHDASLLYDSREIYSALGPLHKRPVMQSVVAAMERHYARSVDRVIVSGELDAEYMRQHLKRREKPTVVMNVPPYADVRPSAKLRERFAIAQDCPVVVYQGAVLEGRGIEVLLRCMDRMPSLHFCVIGDGPGLDSMKLLAASLGLEQRSHFLGSIPNHELLSWTASADVGLCFVEPISFSYKLALPNKLFEYAMARIPALVSDLPAMREVIESHPFGELVSPDASAETIVNKLGNLLEHPERYRAAADKAARVYNREAQHRVIAAMAEEMERL